jgi:hypothetical protein
MEVSIRRGFIGATLFFALLPLSFVFEAGRVRWFTLRDQPLVGGVSWALAVLCGAVLVRSARHRGR